MKKPTHTPARLRFAQLVADIRRRQGMLKKDVATKAGVTPGAVTLWENGSRVPRNPDGISALSKALLATEEEHQELLRAAGFADQPATDLELLERLRRFLLDPQVSTASKSELTGLIIGALNLVEIKEAGFGQLQDDVKSKIIDLIKSSCLVSERRRSA